MKTTRNTYVINFIVPIIILLALSLVLFVMTAQLAHADDDMRNTFLSLTGGIDQYYDFNSAWKPRLFSNALAAQTARLSEWIMADRTIPFVEDSLELTVALWTGAWFGLTGLFIIWFAKKQSLFYLFGTFAGLSFGYMPRLAAIRVYPWDLPALLLFALFVALFVRKRYWWLFAMIPMGVGFKETVIILCVAFLFADLPWKQRWLMAIGSGLLCVGVKIGLDLYTHSPVFFTMKHGLESSRITNVYVVRNLLGLKEIFPFFINAGTLLAFLILPLYNRNIVALKVIAILFIAGNMFFGNIFEYRIYFEMIPLALYALDVGIYGEMIEWA